MLRVMVYFWGDDILTYFNLCTAAYAGAFFCLLSNPIAASAQTTGGGARDLVSNLYGGDGITLDPVIAGHVAHFTASSSAALNNLSGIIASNVNSYAFNSTVAAVSFDLEQGLPVRTRESLGPILAERARTIGSGRVNVGASYAYIDYKRLNGVKLHDLTLDLTHLDVPGDSAFEKDIVRLNIDLNLTQQRVAFFGSYGVTGNVDVSLIVPIVQVHGSVASLAQVIPPQNAIHRFTPSSEPPFSTNRASAVGLGDISVRAKWYATSELDLPLDAALVGQATIATGDEKDLLGSGAHSVYVGGVASKSFGRISPHLNVGYEQYFSEGGTPYKRTNARAVVGFDVGASPTLAFSTEVLARWLTKGQDFYDLALGAKWEAVKGVPFTASIVLPINRNKGLRPDYVLVVGLESTF